MKTSWTEADNGWLDKVSVFLIIFVLVIVVTILETCYDEEPQAVRDVRQVVEDVTPEQEVYVPDP